MNLRLPAAMLLVTALCGCAAGGGTAVREQPGNSPAEINVKLGVGYLQRGQYKIALEKLQKALEENPDLATAHTTIAVVYDQIGKAEKAEEHYRRAVDLEPDSGMMQMNLATFLCQSGKFEEAEEHFLAALEDPFYQTPELSYTNAGICMARKGDLRKAEHYLRLALQIDRNYAGALYQLSRVMYRQERFLSARAFIQRFDSAAPVTAGSLYLGALIERELGNQSGAAAYARTLNAQFPDSPQARLLAERASND